MIEITELVLKQRTYFDNNQLSVEFRIQQLTKLYQQIKKHEPELLAALKHDLNKSEFEAYAMEIGLIYEEIKYMRKHIKSLAKPKRHKTPLMHMLSTSHTYTQPYGCVLIMAPWNYPFQLAISPLIGAIAAGNCIILKPAHESSKTSAVIAKILSCFDEAYISCVEGGLEVNQALLAQHFDYIFFTGSPRVGKIVMEAATKNLTPVTLELGGKSPVIVKDVKDIDLAAKRIMWGKLINAGQTCVAPDYILVDESIKAELVVSLNKYIEIFYGKNPINNPEYPKIITKAHYERLCNLIPSDKLVCNPDTLQIAPVILDNTSLQDPIMQSEIFGPILPVISFNSISEAKQLVKVHERPLALYIFSDNKALQQDLIKTIPYGGGCINDTLIHVGNHHIPFGGIGNSGMGNYHGKQSFYTFSHTKSIMNKSNLFDLNVRYAPFKDNVKLLRLLMK